MRMASEVLNACEHEAAVTALIADVVPRIQRGAIVEVGIRQAEAEAKAELRPEPGRKASARGPRIGQRGDPE